MAQDEVVIRTEGLGKIFVDFWGRAQNLALENLNIEVYRGEIFGLLGPNGSGKSTTMKILLGLLFPTSGKAGVLGADPRDVPVKKRIGYLPEESYLYRFLDSMETLDFYGRLFDIPRKERRRRSEELLKMVGLWEVRRRRVGQYSKGMARRLGFAQALINDPELIFLDEPTSGLDPIVCRQLKDLTLDLKARGKTILMSSHLLADVQDVCDRIAILHLGKLRKTGTVRDLLTIREQIQITTQGMKDETRKQVEELVRKDGGKVLSVGNPSATLEDLFLKTIRESENVADPVDSRRNGEGVGPT